MIVANGAAARLLAAAIALPLAVCAGDPILPDIPKIVSELRIAPYEQHEECAVLVAGDRLDYYFEAKAPVTFNIRYRAGGMVLSPVARENSLGHSGIFVPPLAQRYCLWWEAGPQGSLVDYRIRLLRAIR